MNIVLWILQTLLALHTFAGALWKFFNPNGAVPSLRAISHDGWLALSIVEILCSVALLLPAVNKRFAKYPVWAAIIIAVEMGLFIAVHIASGSTENAEIIYWAIVAAIAGFVAYGRLVLKPFSVKK